LAKVTNIEVRLGGKIKTSEQLIRRFNKLCKQERIVKEYRDKLVFRSKSQKNRDKKAASQRRTLRAASKKRE
jgi:ribosomal protein S21